MTDSPHRTEVPPEWLDIIEESEADLAAGRIVPGDVVMRELRDALAELEAKATFSRKPKAAARR